eukprot:Gb_34259 [translate_table: standard]
MASDGQKTVHDFTVKDIRGNNVDLIVYKGKVLLIVNVASQCGLTTSNYKELGELHQKYKDQGLAIGLRSALRFVSAQSHWHLEPYVGIFKFHRLKSLFEP